MTTQRNTLLRLGEAAEYLYGENTTATRQRLVRLVEHLVAGFGIMRRAAELGIELSSPADLFQPAKGALADLRRQFEHGLLVTITAAVVSADPEIVVLGGAIANSLAGSIESIRNQLRSNVRIAPAIELAVLGDLSGALGASVDALHSIHRRLGVPPSSLSRIPGLQAETSVAAMVPTPRRRPIGSAIDMSPTLGQTPSDAAARRPVARG